MYLNAFENGDIPHEEFIEQINALLMFKCRSYS